MSRIRKILDHPAIAPALQAFKIYWPAILGIQICALGVVFGYYKIESTHTLFDQIQVWKQNGGLFFAAVTTIISGGVIPECIKRIYRPNGISPPSKGELLHQFVMWAWLGILVDSFYKVLALLFGNGTDVLTLIAKVMCDQFLFTPLMSLPLIVSWFILYETRYNLNHFQKQLRLSIIWRRVSPLWSTCLTFWPMMLTLIFSMPQTLQFPLFLFGNAAFSILMIFILRRQVA